MYNKYKFPQKKREVPFAKHQNPLRNSQFQIKSKIYIKCSQDVFADVGLWLAQVD